MDQPPTSNRPDDLKPDLPTNPSAQARGQGNTDITPASSQGPSSSSEQTPPAPVGPPLTPMAWLRANSAYLFFFALLVVWLYTSYGLGGVWKAFLVVVGLGFVVFIHELGHFLAAKWCDVHVQTFSVGFGPALPGCSFQRGETTYKLAVVPLGGYVSMVGEGTEEEGGEDDPRSFKNKTVGQRMLIISAGVIMNVILGCICFVILYRFHGMDRAPAIVWRVDPGSPAWTKGVRTDSVIERIGSVKHPWFEDLRAAVALDQKLLPIDFEFKSRNGTILNVGLAPRKDYNDPYPIIGVASPPRLKLPPPEARKARDRPVYYNSAAAAARVMDLLPGDRVVRCTNPAKEDKVTDLPRDRQEAYDELCKRLRALKEGPLELYVLPRGAAEGQEPKKVVVPNEGFEFGDRIVGTTDPDTPEEPFNIKALPPDVLLPRDNSKRKEEACDPFEFTKRMKLLAGKPAVIQVVRDPSGEKVNLLVPPAYHYTLGMTMYMGKVVAIRDNSPASKTDLQAATDDVKGDQLVELKVSFVRDKVEQKSQVLKIADTDPMRLPDVLARLAAQAKKDGCKVQVTATVLRLFGKEQKEKALEPMDWDDSWDFQLEVPVSLTSPLSIPQLGIAYRVKTMVERVKPDSPASRATEVVKVAGFWDWLKWFFGYSAEKEKDGEETSIQDNDELQKIRLLHGGKKPGDMTWTSWREMKSRRGEEGKEEVYDQWPYYFWYLQSGDYHEIQVKVFRGNKELDKPLRLKAEEDLSWPQDDRGLLLVTDMRLLPIDSTLEAVQTGLGESLSFIKKMYLNLASLIRGRISTKTLGGPIELASQTFAAADDPFILMWWLGMISLNLAVVNFLPIPVLDGGHMVFLIYEKLRGRPPSETVRAAATYLGLAMIFSLMLFVFYQDIMRRLLGWWSY